MKKKLMMEALLKFLFGLLLVGLLLFLPAGTLHYWNAWLFMGLLFIPMLLLGVVLCIKAPALLEKRLNSKEQQPAQKRVVALSAVVFIVGFVLAALDFRYAWTHVPSWLVAVASMLLLFAYGLYAEVMRENAYLSRTVEVQENQKVVDTGLYGVVRHPMYLATILLYLAIPLVLGSLLSLLVFLSYPILIVRRIRNEETVLEQGLEGYLAYEKKVRYRLIPFLW
ncbi:MAG: isoprenylcysteine carboxylmethyltransferase family protein [Clostridia bacterium]|nr:isoprenylcysteine carboxylmethyltransferase family protein [Clostridia bacterium]